MAFAPAVCGRKQMGLCMASSWGTVAGMRGPARQSALFKVMCLRNQEAGFQTKVFLCPKAILFQIPLNFQPMTF